MRHNLGRDHSILAAAATALALSLAAPVQADPRPRVEIAAADEAGGLWLKAVESGGRVFLRFCERGFPARCSPWAAADLGWEERLRDARSIPRGGVLSLTIERD